MLTSRVSINNAEAYLLIGAAEVDWNDRAHFFAIAANITRRILVDRACARVRAKRGGDVAKINLVEIPDFAVTRYNELVAVDDVVDELAKLDPRKARVVELRFFGGLSVEETSACLASWRGASCVTGAWRGPGHRAEVSCSL